MIIIRSLRSTAARLFAITALSFTSFAATAVPLQPGLLLDPQFQACLDEATLANGWTLTEEVRSLTCSASNIEFLDGIQSFTNLIELDLSENQIKTTALLDLLTQLQILNLSNNQLGDLYPLQMLHNLTQLNLSNNKSSDIYMPAIDIVAVNQVIQANPGITHLGIAGVTIGDLNQLAIFGTPQETGLIELDISHTGVSDVSRLSSAISLRLLKASGNTIQDVWWIDQLQQLDVLDLSNNQLADVTSLQMLHQLRQLNLSNNQAANQPYYMPPIDLLAVNQIIQVNPGITHLGIAGITIGDLNQLAIFGTPQETGLVELDISNTGVSDISRLSSATNLRLLKASGNTIQDVWWIEQLQSLEVLDLSNNQLVDVTSLQMLHKLRQLNLSNNQTANLPYYMPPIDLLAVNQIIRANPGITHLGIAGVAIGDLNQLAIFGTPQEIGLIELDISNTGVTELFRLYPLTKLRVLKASDNFIFDVYGVGSMPYLQVLDLSNNQLSDLYELQMLHNLEQLDLSNNKPIDINMPMIDLSEINQVIVANPGITHLGVAGVAIGDLNQLAIFGTPQQQRFIELDISNTGVSDISLLSSTTNLRILKASENTIQDVWWIDQLQSLEVLDLSNNQLADVTSLQMLHKLRQLNLSNNQAANQPYYMPPIDLMIVNQIIQANPGITHLGIAGITIGDLNLLALFGTPLETGLIELDISNTGVSDISILSYTTKLRILKASGNTIQDVWWIDQLQSLEVLDLSNNQLTDVTSLQMLHKLSQLNLSNNQAAYVPHYMPPIDLLAINQIIQANPGITHLGLAGITIGDLNQLAIFGRLQETGLIELDISHTGVSDISLLSSTTNLRILKASGNTIQDVYWIDQLQSLEVLDLSNNTLADVYPLQALNKLRQLNLSNNQTMNQPYMPPIDLKTVNRIIQANLGITHLGIAGVYIGDITQLSVFGRAQEQGLIELDISDTGITSLHPLYYSQKLQVLKASNNAIADLNGLESLHQLQVLDLSDNRLGDLFSLQWMHNLTQLNLSNNQPYYAPPIDLLAVNQIIQANLGITHLGIAGITIGDLNQLAILGRIQETDLIELNISSTGVSDISRLLTATNLRILKASGNTIQDVWWIDQLQQLEVLDLNNNTLVDVFSLSGLHQLTQLNLSNNQAVNQPYYMPPIDLLAVNQIIQANPGITHLGIAGIAIGSITSGDLSQLAIFGRPQEIELIELDISNTGVTDVSRLSSAINLRTLKASGNTIQDVYWIDQLQQLEVLDLSNNQLGDVTSLQMLHKLRQLNLSNNQAASQPYSIPPIDLLAVNQIIQANPGITHLGLAGITIGDLNQLAIFGRPQEMELIELDISNTEISSLILLNNSQQLRVLNASNNAITDLYGLDSLLQLQVLDLSNNQLSDVNSLQLLHNLEQLNLSNNKSLDAYMPPVDLMTVNQIIRSNPGLTHLGLAGIHIGILDQLDIFATGISNNIVELDVSNSGLLNLDAIYTMTSLRVLKASGNLISDAYPLITLQQLEVLDLSNNDIQFVLPLGDLVNLNLLDLSGNNNIQCAELDQLETTLQAGVLIRPESCVFMSPPTVMIHQPFDGMSFYTTELIEFMADAFDPEDGDLAQNVQWTSSLSGFIGTGSIITPMFSAGEQVVTASVTDSHGNTRSVSINISVLPNTLPEILIYSVMDGAVFNEGDDVYIGASANDLEDGDVSYNLQWSSDIDGFLGTGSSMIARLSAGNHIITATVMDYAGASSTQSVSITINALPQLTIQSPLDGSLYQQGDSVTLNAIANDTEEGDLTAVIEWTSNIQGLLGSGASLTQVLSIGTHYIGAEVRDSNGGFTLKTVTIVVNGMPQLNLLSPLNAGLYQEGDIVNFSASAFDAEDGDLDTSINWISNLQGNIGTGAQLTEVLSVGHHIVTVSITDSAGVTVTQTTAVTVNSQPKVSITSPVSGALFMLQESVNLSATANDLEDGVISAAIEWSSNLDGFLGTGASLTKNLTLGTHTITASITDSAGGVFTTGTQVVIDQVDLRVAVSGNGSRKYATLTWSGSRTAVDIYKNGVLIRSAFAGNSTVLRFKNQATFKVCETATNNCSVEVVAVAIAVASSKATMKLTNSVSLSGRGLLGSLK